MYINAPLELSIGGISDRLSEKDREIHGDRETERERKREREKERVTELSDVPRSSGTVRRWWWRESRQRHACVSYWWWRESGQRAVKRLR